MFDSVHAEPRNQNLAYTQDKIVFKSRGLPPVNLDTLKELHGAGLAIWPVLITPKRAEVSGVGLQQVVLDTKEEGSLEHCHEEAILLLVGILTGRDRRTWYSRLKVLEVGI